MMHIGEKIKQARIKAGKTLEWLGDIVGLTKGTLSGYEKGHPKAYDPETLCRISDALNDLSILTDFCQMCPVRKHIFLKKFPDLNNIRPDLAIVAGKLSKEMSEAMAAADELSERFAEKDFKEKPGYKEAFEREMEQIVDVERCIEILKFELVRSFTHSSRDLQRVDEAQQEKCIANGHHKIQAEESAA